MKQARKQDGQTVVETALVIILILMIFFGIAEIARAWWTKGQLNNAARVGARVAVVQSTLSAGGACQWSGACGTGSSDEVVRAACSSITNQDLCTSANVSIGQTAQPPAGIAGDEITVAVTGNFNSVVPGLSTANSPQGWGSLYPGSKGLTGTAMMRHE